MLRLARQLIAGWVSVAVATASGAAVANASASAAPIQGSTIEASGSCTVVASASAVCNKTVKATPINYAAASASASASVYRVIDTTCDRAYAKATASATTDHVARGAKALAGSICGATATKVLHTFGSGAVSTSASGAFAVARHSKNTLFARAHGYCEVGVLSAGVLRLDASGVGVAGAAADVSTSAVYSNSLAAAFASQASCSAQKIIHTNGAAVVVAAASRAVVSIWSPLRVGGVVNCGASAEATARRSARVRGEAVGVASIGVGGVAVTASGAAYVLATTNARWSNIRSADGAALCTSKTTAVADVVTIAKGVRASALARAEATIRLNDIQSAPEWRRLSVLPEYRGMEVEGEDRAMVVF